MQLAGEIFDARREATGPVPGEWEPPAGKGGLMCFIGYFITFFTVGKEGVGTLCGFASHLSS